MRVHLLERHTTGFDESDRRLIGTPGDTEGTDQMRLFDDDHVADEVRHRLEALDPGEHDAAAGSDVVQRFGDRLGRIRRDLDDDVGTAAVGQLLHAGMSILALDVDDVIGAEVPGQLQLRGIPRQPGNDDPVGTGGARCDDTGEAALSGTEDEDRIPGTRARHLDRPPETGAERVEHDSDVRGNVRAHPVHDGVRVEVHVIGVGAPQPGRP